MEVTITTDEHIYRGSLLRRDSEGLLIDVSGERVFVPGDEVFWIGKDLEEDEVAEKFRKRYRQRNRAIIIAIVLAGIVAVLVRRWLL